MDWIILFLIIECSVCSYISYRNLKAINRLHNVVLGLGSAIEQEAKKVNGNVSAEIKKQFYNMSFMGIKVK